MDPSTLYRRNCAFFERLTGSVGNAMRMRHKKVKRQKRKHLPVLTNFNNLKAMLVKTKGGTAQSKMETPTTGKNTRGSPVKRNDEFTSSQKMIKKRVAPKSHKTIFEIIDYLISSHHDQEFIRRHNVNPLIMAATLSRHTVGHSKTSTRSSKKSTNKSSEGIDSDTSVSSPKSSTSKEGSRRSKKRSASRRSTGRTTKKYLRDNPTFILSQPDRKKGHTRFPDRGLPPKLFTFGTEPAYAYMHAFREKIRPKKDYYSDNTTAAAVLNEGPPHYVFYPNHELAIEISKGEKGAKMIVYSISKLNQQGEWIDSRPMAIFDSKGNGVVYDIDGGIRMNYDQVEGAIYNQKNGQPVMHWYWKGSSLVTQRRIDLETFPEDPNDDVDSENIDLLRSGDSKAFRKGSSNKSFKGKGGKRNRSTKQNKHKKTMADALKKSKCNENINSVFHSIHHTRPLYKHNHVSIISYVYCIEWNMLQNSQSYALNLETSVARTVEQREKTVPPFSTTDYSPVYDVRPIVIKITDFISLRIVDQKHIHLDFTCERIHYRFYLGFIVRTNVLERIDKIIVSKSPETFVPCYFEILPNRSESLKNINRRLVEIRQQARAQRIMRAIKRARIFGYHVWFKRRRAV